jgi:hypothetical protein
MKGTIFSIIMRLFGAGTFLVVALLGAQAVNAQTPRADYQLQSTYNSAVSGAPNLVNIGGGFQTETVDGSSRTVFKFAKNNGLQLSPTTPIIPHNNQYTIVLLLRFEQVSGYNRVIDFKSGDPDSGAYIQDGHLEHGGGRIVANQYVQIVYTRDGTKESQRGYVDGVRVLDGLSASASDLPIGPSNTLVFFIDDGDESSIGAIARLRIYDRALSDAEVAALDRLPGPPPAPVVCSPSTSPNTRSYCVGDLQPRRIPSTIDPVNPNTLQSGIFIPDHILIRNIRIRLWVTHPNINKLKILLAPPPPSGDEIRIPSSFLMLKDVRPDTAAPDMGRDCSLEGACILDSRATESIYSGSPPYIGSYKPQDDLTQLFASSARGLWNLKITNNTSFDGELKCWSLEIETFDVASANKLTLPPFFEVLPTFSIGTFDAKLTRSDGTPISGKRVDFYVRGRNNFLGTLITDANGIASLSYRDCELCPRSGDKGGTDHISAVVNVDGELVAGLTIVFWYTPPLTGVATCPCGVFVATCDGDSRVSPSSLNLEHSFRDTVLAKTPKGQRYTELYYKHAGEMVRLLLFDPILFLRARDLMKQYEPLVQAMVNRTEMIRVSGAPANDLTITEGDLEAVDELFSEVQSKASLELRQDFAEVRRDLKDPQVHREFGIKVARGPRSVAANHSVQELKKGLLLSTTLSCFLVFGYRLARSHNKTRQLKKSMARWLILILIGYCTVANLQSGAVSQMTSGHQVSARNWGHFSSTAGLVKPDPVARARANESFNKLPLTFEARQNQQTSQTEFISRGSDYDFAIRPTEAMLSLRRDQGSGVRGQDHFLSQLTSDYRPPTTSPATDHRPPTADVLRMKLVGTNPAPRFFGMDELSGKINYLTGNDRSKWRANLSTFAKVVSQNVFPGVDLIYYGNQRQLEYDFKVAPAADPEAIRFMFAGAEQVEVEGSGDLLIRASGEEIRQRKPFIYQEVDGIKHEISGGYALKENNQIGFQIGAYDRAKPLVIDPVLVYSTYLGGNGRDEGNSITVDAAGNTYIVGVTDSTNFPTASPFQSALGGPPEDCFVAKLSPSGALVYCTYLGGNEEDFGSTIAVDAGGNAYICGFTASTNFPTANTSQTSLKGKFDAFITKLNPAGSGLVYSTYFGGSDADYGSGIAVDTSGNAYVTGVTASTDLPTAKPLQPSFGGSHGDAFIAKLNPSGATLFSTYLGGSGVDGGTSIGIDAAGNAYVAGITYSANFPMANAVQPTFGGSLADIFVTKLNATGTAMVYSTYFGRNGDDRAYRIAVDAAGNAYVTGMSDSQTLQTVNAVQPVNVNGFDAVILKLDPSGGLVYSTFLGGLGDEGGTGIAVDRAGNAYIAGFTDSSDFPVSDALQPTLAGGGQDIFLTKLGASGSMVYSTFLGGSGKDRAVGLSVDASGNAYVLGQTDSRDFPLSSASQQVFGGGSSDVFIAKIREATGGFRITSASVSGKMLIVNGEGFSAGAKIILNGEVQKKTANDEQNPTTTLIALKAGKLIARGQSVTLQVRNPDGSLSNVFTFTRPAN